MSDGPFVPFYTSDFLAGTGGMTAATKGVYITLLCLMYEKESPLTQAMDVLARRCGCTVPAFKKAIQALSDDGKLTVSDAGLWSEKCDKHIALRRERRNSAKAAAKTRWEKIQQKQGMGDAGALSPQCKPEPEPYKKEEDKSSSQKKRGARLPDDWTLPKKWGEWAIGQGWAESSVRTESEKFKDYWISKSGKDATKLDWFATWRNWMRNSRTPKITAINGGSNVKPSKQAERLSAFISGARGTP